MIQGLLVIAAGLVLFQPDQMTHQFMTTKKLFPLKGMEPFSLGYNEIGSDILWLRLIQDFHYCENSNLPKSYNSGKGLSNALETPVSPSRCHLGWVYHMLDSITDLAPRFRQAYRYGATGLAIGVDDREGARRIYEKGLARFPDYWQLAFEASYLYLFEIKEPARAADLLLQANRYGGPPWLPLLAARLYNSDGQVALARSVLQAYLETNPDPVIQKRAYERLKEIEGH